MCLPSVSSHTWVSCGAPSGISVASWPYDASFNNCASAGVICAFDAMKPSNTRPEVPCCHRFCRFDGPPGRSGSGAGGAGEVVGGLGGEIDPLHQVLGD